MQLPVIMGSAAEGFSEIRVGGISHRYEEGQPILFDDTFLHEVHNCSTMDRVVLLVDIWHPELTAEDVELISKVFSPLCPPARADVVFMNEALGTGGVVAPKDTQQIYAADESQSEADLAVRQELQSVLREIDDLKRELNMHV